MLDDKLPLGSRRWWQRPGATATPDEVDAPSAPARAELFSSEQLRRHFRSLAESHRLAHGRRRGDPLLTRLGENEQIIADVYRHISRASANKRRLAPAAEWLLDNNYLIEEQIRTARRHFPRSYNRELPKLANGPLAGYARTYVLANELIRHVDARVDADSLATVIGAYQEVAPLNLGELWSVPIMLRLALIENLRLVATRIAIGREEVEQAERWADRLLEMAEHRPTELVIGLAELSRTMQRLTATFVSDFSRRIQGRHHGMSLVLSWIEQRLGEHGATIEQLVHSENQSQAADQVSVGHSIGSLRFLGSLDWREFVESQSVVEKKLATDPTGIYRNMAFITRDQYRHAVEKIARRSALSEEEVAGVAVSLASSADTQPGVQPGDDGDMRQRHVGWWLIGGGRGVCEATAKMRKTLAARLAAWCGRHAFAFYQCGILLPSLAVWVIAYLWAVHQGVRDTPAVLIACGAALVASQAATTVVNWLCSVLVKPQPLPRLDFVSGLPRAMRTLVVVPCLLDDARTIDAMLERIEVHWVGNRDPQVGFLLLSDFIDSTQPHHPTDQALMERMTAGVEALNRKWHDPERGPVFSLMHRDRTWNPRDQVWMGWERKRGKLAQLNQALRQPWPGGTPSGFSTVIADSDWLHQVRYITVLDADTQLPMETVRKLTAAMAHPLNRPRFDPHTRVVVQGHGLLQPRVALSLPSAGRSRYARLGAIDPGVDPYTRAVSDCYQDLFDQGSFIGKGIYDVDAFEHALHGRAPEGTILSHDLLEGCYIRSGGLSDVLLFEDTPSRYLADAARRHRWIRGDWQVAGWLRRRVPLAAGGRERNPLGPLSQWKLLDNLRRSLVPVATLGWLAICWLLGWHAWLAVPAAMWLAGPLLSVVCDLLGKPSDLPWRAHLRQVVISAGQQLAQQLASIAMLAHEAAYSTDAILRAVIRMHLTRRRLLEWKTAWQAERQSRLGLVGHLRAMMVSPLIASALALGLVMIRPAALPLAAPLLGLWLIAPVLAWWLSRPLRGADLALPAEETRWLRRRARRTWRWFETFQNAENHFLPPDNYQEHPVAVVAHRTSPTNIGMAMVCQLAACDFGWQTSAALLEITLRTLDAVGALDRYRGHLYNWYDTKTLKPLSPNYISTVDSGNLVGCLLVLTRGLEELPAQPIVHPQLWLGLRDTLGLYAETAGARARDVVNDLDRRLASAPKGLSAQIALLERTINSVGELRRQAGHDEAQWWTGAFERQCQHWHDELRVLAPWCDVPTPPTEPHEHASLQALRVALIQLEQQAPTLTTTARLRQSLAPHLEVPLPPGQSAAVVAWRDALRTRVSAASDQAERRLTLASTLAERARALADVDFTFLYDRSRDLFTIGYNATDHRLDSGYYDLLASEARLASFIAIAQGQVKQEHWFTLGRLLTSSGGEAALVSWSGSMFEYLMPLLLMPSHEGTILNRTYQAVVARQIAFAREHDIPWGISESGYNATDAQLNYQYRAFGVPGLGLKRGLGDDLVIAPYASALATMVEPRQAVANLHRLAEEDREGPYGFYEAIDYTPSRVPPGQTNALVRSWMAHHQGMALLSYAYLLLEQPMQRRFLADPLFKAADLLLHEKVPRAQAPVMPHADDAEPRRWNAVQETSLRVFTEPATPVPEVHLLSNGRYHVMISAAGGGYSRWRDLAVTRWREDWTRDAFGQFCYLRDRDAEGWWSTAYQPRGGTAGRYEAVFTQGRAEFKRRDGPIDCHLGVAVSPEDDVEVRRVTLTNVGSTTRVVEATTYAEVVIAAAAQDLAHPSFSNLFVTTEILATRCAILCTRRARANDEHPPWLFHLVSVEGTEVGEASFETSRAGFLGHGRSPVEPVAMTRERLAGSDGSVIDPIIAIRRSVRIEPDTIARIDIVTGMAETREQAIALIERYRERRIAERVFEMAWTHSQVVLRQLGIDESSAQMFGRLAGSVIYPATIRRAPPALIASNRRGQAGLWGYGISGDLPLVLLRIADPDRLDLVTEVAQAHAYWRSKGLTCDLVVLVEDRSVYRQPLHEQVLSRVSATPGTALDRPGGVFVRRFEQIAEEDRVLVQAAARVVISDAAGSLLEQLERRPRPESLPPRLAKRSRLPSAPESAEPPSRELILTNGVGGFTPDGREYVMTIGRGRTTPTAWSNVIANEQFGTVVDEGGAAYTWAENCHEFRLTTWNNDPVTGAGGEALWLRDDDTGQLWTPTPWPGTSEAWYVVRHGFGYSVWEHTLGGITSELTLSVAVDAPVKLLQLRLHNRSGKSRRISLTGYWELVMGELRHKNAPHIITAIDAKTGAMIATNAFNTDFGGRVVFADALEGSRSSTGDRLEFLGRNGVLRSPLALSRVRLSNKVGAGLDPCMALMSGVELADGQERDITFIFGCGRDLAQAQALIERFRAPGESRRALEAMWAFWKDTLGVIHVETPDPAVNVAANGWLLYQVLSSRFWARSGFYQSGGAWGFRDQLQDVIALLHASPQLVRAHLLRAAAHQFGEGDVLHWWHPPLDRGVRTHFSDDYLWLPWATAQYLQATGDLGVLDEKVPFLEGRPLLAEEEARYDQWGRAPVDGTLYEHCLRAVRHGLRFGVHGLPLIGCGDWNDGMNRVGVGGKGESVWLGFFLCDVLARFGAVCARHGDLAASSEFTAHRAELATRLDAQAWDGAWYTRAFFDDGTPLGSHTNLECQIDSLPQSWSVLAGATDPLRARQAMESVFARLVDPNARLIKLFDPPFDTSPLDPGYIKGYVPGVRENGGQYTHAAIWTAMAMAELGDTERAWQLTRYLLPATHSASVEGRIRYQVEPYVVAADIYAVAPHVGRGGWTWYTGSAGWLYRLLVGSLVGLELRDGHLAFHPRVPEAWNGYRIHYRFGTTFYHIELSRGPGPIPLRVTVDGVEQPDLQVQLIDDQREHRIDVTYTK